MKWLLTSLNIFYILFDHLPPIQPLDTIQVKRKRRIGDLQRRKEKRMRHYADDTFSTLSLKNSMTKKLYDIYSLLDSVMNRGNERPRHRNVTSMVSNNNEQEDYVVMVTEVNMTTAESQSSWWLDFVVTIHVCNNKEMFKTLKEIDAQEVVIMRNNAGAKVLGK
ncbi:hypothetical protein LIER_09785 [Lithospermum erythrorhizon]|uniref:Uncharacterized protein n=1 Tax=Lithospermum erythrorhizon TaxID=34254 RepID=A0AAV3PL94_LITER